MSTELPVSWDITIYQGATWRLHLRWRFADDTTQDLTGWTGRMQVRRRPHLDPVYLDLSTENGGMTLDAGGNIVLVATATQTSAIPRAPRYYYDIELYQINDGDTFRFAMGEVTLSEEVTVPTA